MSNLLHLATEIRSAHEAATTAAESALEHAIRCGKLLTEAKALVGHGAWSAWLSDHFPASARTASNYMRVAREGQRFADPQRVADLSLRGALRELAPPRSVEQTTDDIVDVNDVERARSILAEIDPFIIDAREAMELLRSSEYDDPDDFEACILELRRRQSAATLAASRRSAKWAEIEIRFAPYRRAWLKSLSERFEIPVSTLSEWGPIEWCALAEQCDEVLAAHRATELSTDPATGSRLGT